MKSESKGKMVQSECPTSQYGFHGGTVWRKEVCTNQGLPGAQGHLMHKSRFPSWWTIRSKEPAMSSCCLHNWLTLGRSQNFKDFDLQLGEAEVARNSASLSC